MMSLRLTKKKENKTEGDPYGGHFSGAPPVDNLWITNVMYLTPQMGEMV